LVPDPLGWWLRVTSPTGDARSEDFLWPVSPPFQTAPQLAIGTAYGLKAEESVAAERRLRFVVYRSDYQKARAIAVSGDPSAVERSIKEFGKGSLRFKVTGFELGGTQGAPLRWISFEGDACINGAP
jgi:hypothetical protein